MSQLNTSDPEQETKDLDSSSNGFTETSPGDSGHSDSTSPPNESAEQDVEKNIEMLGKLPPEIGMLLILSGIAGVLLPGPVGMPLLIAGGVTMWPKTFEPIERWFSRRFPVVHREGVFQLKELISSLKNRFPDSP